MADNDYTLLREDDEGQVRSMDTNIYKNGGFDSPMGIEGGRTPPPPYTMNMTPQPYGMVSSPVNPMMMQQGALQQQSITSAPQQPHIPPPQPQVVHVISHQQIAGPTSVGQKPLRIQCPSCREFIKSKIDRQSICKTHMWACCLFFCLCWPCVCIPYCSSSCRDANHTCPNCGAFLGTYKA